MFSMLSALLSLVLCASAGSNLLVNPGFDEGLKNWQKNNDATQVEAVKMDGRTVVRITVSDETTDTSHMLCQEVPVQGGALMRVRAEAMRTRITKGLGAFVQVTYLNEQGQKIGGIQSDYVVTDNHWTPLTTPLHGLLPAPLGTVRACVSLVFQGRGEACFDNVELTELHGTPPNQLSAPVTLKMTDQVVCDNFFGFGAEDDGWFYYGKNVELGANEEDSKMREARIRWIKPAWMRSFIALNEWCPSGDWKTFTFESPGMQSHYRALDIYQKIGARIDITGVAWRAMGTVAKADPEAEARAIGELLEYMIKKRGLTNIKYWTLTNEPDGGYMRKGDRRFTDFLKIHQLVKAEIKRRGLDVQIIGSDDANSLSFFETCATNPEYFALADVLCSHVYIRRCNTFMAPEFFDSRMKIAENLKPRKPFIVGECGMLGDWFTAMDNPTMLTYPYAIWATAFAIEGLNRGVSGFSIWTMNETFYPFGTRMQFGLWDFKDNGWKVRPVYHAWANLCRLTGAGDKVRRVDSSNPDRVLGSVVNSTLFWVNRADQPAEVVVEGLGAKEVRIMEEKTLAGDRECGVVEKLKDGRFTAPPQSFGYAR
jgi:hypothetical protein